MLARQARGGATYDEAASLAQDYISSLMSDSDSTEHSEEHSEG